MAIENEQEVVNSIITDDIKDAGWAKDLDSIEKIKNELVNLEKLKGQKVVPDDNSTDEQWAEFKKKLSNGANYDDLFGENESELKEIVGAKMKSAGLAKSMARDIKSGIDEYLTKQAEKTKITEEYLKGMAETDAYKKADEIVGKLAPDAREKLKTLDKNSFESLVDILSKAHAQLYPAGDKKPAVSDGGGKTTKKVDADYVKRMREIDRTFGIDKPAAKRALMKEYGLITE